MARLFKRREEGKKSLWDRIKDVALTDVTVLARGGVDEGALERLEELLIAADFGVPSTLRLVEAVEMALAGGAAMLFTPEMSGMLDRDRDRARGSARTQDQDPVLAAVREAAAKAGIWVHLGSLALKVEGDKLANRGFVIDPSGAIRAQYDKIHLFDVDLPTGESWRESAMYRAGEGAVLVPGTPVGTTTSSSDRPRSRCCSGANRTSAYTTPSAARSCAHSLATRTSASRVCMTPTVCANVSRYRSSDPESAAARNQRPSSVASVVGRPS